LNWRAETRGQPTKEIECPEVKGKGGSKLESKSVQLFIVLYVLVVVMLYIDS
jgi:hypothetical protein